MPGRVAPGEWQVRMEVDGTPISAGIVEVTPSGNTVLNCVPDFKRCTLQK
jgi:hypothetical protein